MRRKEGVNYFNIESLSRRYMRTVELGIRAKMDKLYGEPKIACLSNALIEEVSFYNVAPVLLLLVYGMILSLIILIIEIIFSRVGKKKKENQINSLNN